MRTDFMTTEHSFPTFDTWDEAIAKIREVYGTAHWEDVSSDVAVFKWYEWREHYSEPFEKTSLWLEVGHIFRDRWVVWKILGDKSRFTTEDFGAAL